MSSPGSRAPVLIGLILAALLAVNPANGEGLDVSGSSPSLHLSMTRAGDDKAVTEADYTGRAVMLYFGYTHCPDICPTTLANLASVLERLGTEADRVRILFVTVDPDRDSLPLLAEYVKNFAPQIDGLRGTPDQLAALARRYRVVYSVTPAADGKPAEVSHSGAIYVFDRAGKARLLLPPVTAAPAEIDAVAADLRALIDSAG
jgi:protein SCO1/2